MTAFRVDLEELASVVAQMSSCQAALADLVGDVAGEVDGLQATWEGRSRDAHATSHARWRQDFQEMSAALAGIRALAETARGNYSGAVAANLALWEQVR